MRLGWRIRVWWRAEFDSTAAHFAGGWMGRLVDFFHDCDEDVSPDKSNCG